MSARPPRRRRGRDAERIAPSPQPPQRPPPPAGQRGWPSAGAWLLFLLGLWIGRATAVLPEDANSAFGLALTVVTALALALSYRRWVRRAMAARRRPKT